MTQFPTTRLANTKAKMAATDQQWAVGEDWCLSIGTSVNNLIYHSSLNVILLTSKEPSVQVIDVTSGAILHKTDLSGNALQNIIINHHALFCSNFQSQTQLTSSFTSSFQ